MIDAAEYSYQHSLRASINWLTQALSKQENTVESEQSSLMQASHEDQSFCKIVVMKPGSDGFYGSGVSQSLDSTVTVGISSTAVKEHKYTLSHQTKTEGSSACRANFESYKTVRHVTKLQEKATSLWQYAAMLASKGSKGKKKPRLTPKAHFMQVKSTQLAASSAIEAIASFAQSEKSLKLEVEMQSVDTATPSEPSTLPKDIFKKTRPKLRNYLCRCSTLDLLLNSAADHRATGNIWKRNRSFLENKAEYEASIRKIKTEIAAIDNQDCLKRRKLLQVIKTRRTQLRTKARQYEALTKRAALHSPTLQN